MSDAGNSGRNDLPLLQLAVSRGLLAEDDLTTLVADAADSACDLAIERLLLSPSDVDVLRPLADPQEYLAGYEFLDLIGEGASGVVYRARQVRLNRMVALKLLKHSALENQTVAARSHIEAQLGARMRHPGIAAVYDYGVEQGRIYLAMELVEGRSLLQHIEAPDVISESHALHIALQVVHALAHAASAGVVHRDIKPANLILTDELPGMPPPRGVPTVKVLDFGLAMQAHSPEATRLTADGATLGTPCYVAPEQLQSSRVDSRADIYALGATLFHVLTGTQPFASANAFQAVAAKLQGDECWRGEMETLRPPVRQLILDMTHHSVEERIGDYSELARRIGELLDDPAGDERFPRVRRRRGRWRRPIRTVAGLITASAITVTLLLTMQAGRIVERDVMVARAYYLFDGFTTPERQVRGAWRPGTDSEGAPVLAGAYGRIRFDESTRRLTDPAWFEFRVGVHPLDSAAADVCFALQQTDHCHIVRIRDGTARSGVGTSADDEFTADNDGPAVDLLQRADGPGYHQVTINHQSGGWFVDVDGQRLMELPASPEDRPEMLLRAIDGTVHFEGVRFAETQVVDTPPSAQ